MPPNYNCDEIKKKKFQQLIPVSLYLKISLSLITSTLVFNISELPYESQIVNTFQSSVDFGGDSYKLVDNMGLDGIYQQPPYSSG